MGDKADPKVLKKTQDALGKIIKKPPLTEKLLSKPPFRFLHDLCTSIIKTTGFMKGLYTDSEMNSDNVKDKENKIAFLQKAIDITSLVLGRAVGAKPSKIVAGHEPEKTNEWLQAMAEAINKKVDNDEYVKKVLTGDMSSPPEKSSSDKSEKTEKKERERSADRRRRDKDEDREKRHHDRKERPSSRDRGSRDRDGSAHEREKKDRDSGHSRDKERHKRDEDRRDRHRDDDKKDRHRDDDKKDRHRDDDKKDRHRDRDERHKGREDKHRDDKSRDKDRRRHRDDEDENKENKVEIQQSGEGDPEVGKSRSNKLTDEVVKEPTMNGHMGEDEATQPAAPRRLARPSSARPAPPRVKANEPPPEEPAVIGPSNVPNIISDKHDDSSDDDIFETKDDEEAPVPEPSTQIVHEDEDGTEHGGLVKKMMEAKEKLEGGSHAQNQQPKKTEIERSSQVSDATRRKEREMVKKEIDKLRNSIQTLTRSVNPLGKILDFVQEDLDSMQKELERWKGENAENQVALQREQSITESSIEPLRAHLTEIDNAIKDQLDLIAAVKSNVLKNDDKITKMLGSITKS